MSDVLRVMQVVVLATTLSVVAANPGRADDAPSAVGPVMRLLESGRVPAARLEQILKQVATRGNAHDLAYLYQQAIVEQKYDAELQTKVLQMLVEAGADRGITPTGDLSGIATLIDASSGKVSRDGRLAAVRLAGLWKVEAAAEALQRLLVDPKAGQIERDAALAAITRLGGEAAREAVVKLTDSDQPLPLRLQGAAALVGLDVDLAAQRAAAILNDADADTDVQEMVQAFLDRQGASDVLAKAIAKSPPSADVAKRTLRAMYAVGRSDADLSSVLGKIAGIDSDPVPLTNEQVLALVPVVEAEGDAARGEEVFRRADLSCMKCHAVSKGGGQVGPDLSALGASSPIDYILHSISDPDQQIKEAYATRVVVTDEGLVLQGIVANRTPDTLVLKDASGKRVSIPLDSIDEEVEGKSLMPKGLRKFMTDAELLDLAKFLSMLGKPGTEYKIRQTPRMQRWRVLTDLPQEYLDALPDFTAFEDHLHHWPTSLPVYSRVDGHLPLDEVVARGRQSVIYLFGEIEVTQPGPVGVRLDEADGVTMWVDKMKADAGDAIVELPVGTYRITLRIDTASRVSDTLRLELYRPAGSKAEFAVVDGA